MSRIVEDFVANGFRCVIGTGGPSMENFNGYILVPQGHPWHGQDWMDCPAECHGGVTWSRGRLPWEDGSAGDGWWIGFDTCHAGDFIFGVPTLGQGEFKGAEYVRSELLSLAEQAGEWAVKT